MHDWTLVSVLFDWEPARVTLSLRNPASTVVYLVAEGVADLHIPQLSEWGPSVSVNKVTGPSDADGKYKLEIEMQSGDVITIVASTFTLPAGSGPENSI